MPNPPPFSVLLVNLGTPEAPTAKAIRTYLAQFLWDKRVVDAPRPLWWLILNGIILRFRPAKVAKAYASIWTEDGSPLMVFSRKQQAALRAKLKQEMGEDIPVELAMTYGEPSFKQAGMNLSKYGAERIIVLPLFPQNSSSTTAAVFDALANTLKSCRNMPELRFINQYYQHPAYIQALANSVQEHWHEHGRCDKLLMSFHGIPERYEHNGDPYPSQCRATAQALADKLDLNSEQWLCSFQSRFGREEWVKPYTDETLKQWAKEGVKSVQVITPAFSADCLETLEEIGEENREYFLENGGQDYQFITCLNDRADHIQMMSDLILHNTQGWHNLSLKAVQHEKI